MRSLRFALCHFLPSTVRRPIAHPLASLLITAYLIFEVTHLPPGSTVGDWFRPPAPPLPGGGPSTLIAFNDGEPQVLDRDLAVAGQDPRAVSAGRLLLADYRESTSETGFWALTRRRTIGAVYILNPQAESRPITPELEARARAALVDWLVANRGLPAADAAQLRTANIVREQILWPGYLRDALTLIALVLLPASLAWIPQTLTARTRARRRAAGLCIYCKYPIRGLDTPLCPECGRAIPTGGPPTTGATSSNTSGGD